MGGYYLNNIKVTGLSNVDWIKLAQVMISLPSVRAPIMSRGLKNK